MAGFPAFFCLPGVIEMLQLNPNAQVIFATHSPDIVGSYTNRILDMKRIVG
jgi:predicted ATPase